jgi:hypothetical protein
VPLTSGGLDTGAIRRYDVTTKAFTNFVQPGTLGQPWYLTFGYTDPATLAYNPPSAAGNIAAPGTAAAVLALPLSMPTAGTVPSALPQAPQVGSSDSSGSPVSSAVTMTGSVMSTASDSHAGTTDALFAAWADNLFANELQL